MSDAIRPNKRNEKTIDMCPHNKAITECPCVKDCPRHGMCCACVAHHKQMGTKLPACLRGIEWQK